ncbi:MAG: hypothetical protein KAJ46_00225, partial [Sedimentisphaerales bacterium]|nr:hypothetical protein [Sedimentisphaerales bacterium]
EYYDYPGPDDPWLASLEPMFLWDNGTPTDDTDDWYAWRHISDIYDNNFGVNPSAQYFDPDDETNTSQWDSTSPLALWFWVRSTFGTPLQSVFTVARIAGDKDGTECIKDHADTSTEPDIWLWGARADADGDGVADSRWVKVPNLTGPRGQNVYTAVRIIDNGGMININTAYRYPDPTDPDFPVTAGNPVWDGSRLSHVNLEGIRASDDEDVSVTVFQAERYGTVKAAPDSENYHNINHYDNDIKYDDDVSRRLLNPATVTVSNIDYHYAPFDMGDELELRNRYFLSSSVVNRFGYEIDDDNSYLWQRTFDPQADPGKELPYVPGDELRTWFDKVKPDIDQGGTSIGDYNRRFFSTTYNFDRIIRRGDGDDPVGNMKDTEGQRKLGIRLPNDGVGSYSGFVDEAARQEYIMRLAGAIYRGLPDDAEIQNRFGSEYTREIMAWQFAVNLIDYQDAISEPTSIQVTLENNDDVQFFGVESLTDLQQDVLCVSEIGYIKVNNTPSDPLKPNGDYYAIELFNPDDNGQKDNLPEYKVMVIDGSLGTLKREVRLSSGTLAPSDPSTSGIGDTCVVVFGPGGATAAQSAFGFTAVPIASAISVNIQAGDYIVVAKDDGGTGYPQAGHQIPVDCVKVTAVMVTGAANTVVSHDRQHVLPGTHLLLPDATATSLGFIWTSSLSLGNDIDPGTLQEITDAQIGGIDNVQLVPEVSTLLRGLGEIGRVSAVGFYFNTTQNNKCQTPLQGFVDSYKAIDTNDPESEKNVLGGAMSGQLGSYGKIRLDDGNYEKLTDFLTYFDPSNDVDGTGVAIDNDGNPMTSNNPENDGVDQDGDGIDSPAHLIALDPAKYFLGPDNDEKQAQWYEQQIAGRININTAPWFVIAQLPWVSDPAATTDLDKSKLARAIVAYRDKTTLIPDVIDYADELGDPDGRGEGMVDLTEVAPAATVREELGFANIAELLNVTHDLAGNGAAAYEAWYDIRKYGRNGNNDNATGNPPFYSSDVADDDLLERDIIFQRISNLVTVRSDVFTAYIMVRVGELGPQKRVIAIFDRSNVYKSGDTPRLVALHPVPDPR